MPWIRQLDSGLWAATVYTPAGRITDSHPLKTVISKWAEDLEADVHRGEFIDPRKALLPVGEIWEKYGGSRRLERASRKRDESIWRNHVEKRWGKIPVGAVLKPDVQSWVNQMEKDGTGGWVVIAALNVLKAVMELAVDAGCIRSNPARRVKPPIPPQHIDRVLTAEEETLILDRLDELFPGRRDGRPFVETISETGGRWEEIAAVKREAVDLRQGIINIGPVMERDGTIRDYPKGARTREAPGFRPVPISPELTGRLRPAVLATPAGGLVFTGPRGKPLDYSRWHDRVWSRALHGPYVGPPPQRRPGSHGPIKVPLGPWLVGDPQPTPHDLRHTYGTRLAEAEVPEHDRMALMGHKDQRSARRYVHSSDKRFDRARQALAKARGKPSQDHDSRATHDLG